MSTLAACTYIDYWAGDPAATLSDANSWLVLPMRNFVSRDDVSLSGMELCTTARCGYDAAIERFEIRGAEAATLEKSLSQPHALAAALTKAGEKKNAKLPPAKIKADAFSLGAWQGLRVAIMGGPKDHRVSGYAVGQRNGDGATFIVVVAAKDDVARRLIAEATR